LLALISIEADGRPCSAVETDIRTSPRFLLSLPEGARWHLRIRLGGTIERPGEVYGEYTLGAKGITEPKILQKLTSL